MRLLLDTHVLLWRLAGDRRLGDRAAVTIADADELALSVITFAEIGVKASVGKLEVPSEIGDLARDGGLRILRLEPEHGLAVASLPMHHHDPFDRLLIAQARAEGFAIVTADARFREYEVDVVDARL